MKDDFANLKRLAGVPPYRLKPMVVYVRLALRDWNRYTQK